MTGISQCLIGMQWETDLIYVGLYYDNYLFGYDQLVEITLLWSIFELCSKFDVQSFETKNRVFEFD